MLRALIFVFIFCVFITAAHANEAFEAIIADVNKQVAQNKKEYEQSIKVAQEKSAEYKELARQIVEMAEDNIAGLSSENTNPRVTEKWLDDYQKIKENNNTTLNKERLLIFVSFSMPEELLIKLSNVARQLGAKLIIRGFKNNSFKGTINYIRGIQGLAVDIDPRAFEQFDIKLVPAFVVNEGLQFDKLTGNVSVRYALEQFAQHGGTAEKSKAYLKKLGDHEAN